MICSNCQRQADKAKDVFTQRERIQILAAETVMMRHLMANANSPSADKEVGNSIITKMLLSLEPQLREAQIHVLRESAGLNVFVDRCPHGIQGVI